MKELLRRKHKGKQHHGEQFVVSGSQIGNLALSAYVCTPRSKV